MVFVNLDKQHLTPLVISQDFLQKLPAELPCNEVVLFCLYRHMSMYIWFLA